MTPCSICKQSWPTLHARVLAHKAAAKRVGDAIRWEKGEGAIAEVIFALGFLRDLIRACPGAKKLTKQDHLNAPEDKTRCNCTSEHEKWCNVYGQEE